MNGLEQMAQREYPDSPKQIGSDESVRGNLTRTKTRLEAQLKKVNDALTVLDTDPQFASNLEMVLAGIRA